MAKRTIPASDRRRRPYVPTEVLLARPRSDSARRLRRLRPRRLGWLSRSLHGRHHVHGAGPQQSLRRLLARGVDAGLIAKVMNATAGTFVETVLDVFTSARGGVVYAHHAFDAKGEKREYRTMHLYDIRDGKLASFREVPVEMAKFQEAWS